MLFKKCKVIMLSADVKSDTPLGFQTHGCGQDLVIGKTSRKGYGQGDSFNPYYPQHLYILSDDEIKENNWCIEQETNSLFQAQEFTTSGLVRSKKNTYILKDCKKVIATTDTSLLICNGVIREGESCNKNNNCKYPNCKIPKIPKEFIYHFIEEYNKSNIVTDVMVEYETKQHFELDKTKRKDPLNGVWYENSLKINPKDNTITILKVKNSWSRDEVLHLLNELWFNKDNIKRRYSEDFDKWISENL